LGLLLRSTQIATSDKKVQLTIPSPRGKKRETKLIRLIHSRLQQKYFLPNVTQRTEKIVGAGDALKRKLLFCT
jgi:hypothetical protein